MSTRGGGRRGDGDFSRGGHRGGGRGGGRGVLQPRRDPPISGVLLAPPSARHVASSSLSPPVADPSVVLSRGVEKLRIAEVETELLAITATAIATEATVVARPSSSKEMKPPPRPAYGTLGTKCRVRANHFLVEVANRDLNHYDVTITPEVTSRPACRQIISQLVTLYKDSHLGGLTPAYNGRKSLYTAGPLPFTSYQFKVKLTDPNREEYNVTIKYAGRADLHHLQQFLQGRQFDAPKDTIQVLDIALRELPTQKYVPISRSFFSTTFGARRDDGIECWRGFNQSLRPTQMGLSLNIDILATSFYKPVSVVDFAEEYLGLTDGSSPLMEKQLIGVSRKG